MIMADAQVPIRTLDVLAIVVYLGGMIGIALYFARRNTNTEEYFVGGRSFAGWVIGLSMLGTIISSSTFLALPAAAYALDWRQLSVNLVLPLVAVLAVVFFIPLFRHGRMTSAFEYLGLRYGSVPRLSAPHQLAHHHGDVEHGGVRHRRNQDCEMLSFV
ncbi:MAG: hypothetical protein EA424_24185 [Planctomycetaceae bacterium]|nr:MAG: hypothetical protein EA424_24185 [Planctomycetaceae bacterium]